MGDRKLAGGIAFLVLLAALLSAFGLGMWRGTNGGGSVAGQNWTSPSTGMEFVFIPQINAYVGKYEVTNAEYRKMEPYHDSGTHSGHSLNGDRQPVVRVNFRDARRYANWLTKQDRQMLGGMRYRLPSEREWQTFAQVGDGRRYPWGDEWPPPIGIGLNYRASIEGYNTEHHVAAPVDELWRNPWGLYGVGHNVSEACSANFSGVIFGSWRGRTWFSLGRQDFFYCSHRSAVSGSTRMWDSGFRLVLSR